MASTTSEIHSTPMLSGLAVPVKPAFWSAVRAARSMWRHTASINRMGQWGCSAALEGGMGLLKSFSASAAGMGRRRSARRRAVGRRALLVKVSSRSAEKLLSGSRWPLGSGEVEESEWEAAGAARRGG